ncbi:YjiH family protein [Rubrobacter taiwanensis]|jgi:nucleoside recognition membrane protein YjiH|uniref:YjiH family protein n=1 Tax=Rubrobacter taiwanensis TaxID=185139 RepID=A0A4R1BLP1_9ACTN|nr:YjiH family protein [Rubrobacter taiwanensis]TCJ18313.1 YjiH family protein [Rubrobacter taiwanensis]
MEEAAAGRSAAALRFVLTTVVGAFFFLVPVYYAGQWTIPFDVVVSYIRGGFPQAVALYCLVVILASVALSVAAELQARGKLEAGRFDVRYFRTGPAFLFFRLLGGVFAVMIYFGAGPEFILAESAGGLMYNTLVASVAVIVPIGAIFITLFVAFGGLEFVGTLARPVMRPLFRVPGRAALDATASYVGSYSIGLYVTNKMYNEGRYSAREAAVIATCFSTVSMGFFAVVAATLDLLPYFPLIFLSTTFVIIVLAAILCRIPPLSWKPDAYAAEPVREREYSGNLFRHAVEEAVGRAARARNVFVELRDGFIDGLKLTLVIIPTILAIGLLAILLAEHTPLFTWLGAPVEPVLELLGVPDAAIVAPATLIGITEMFLPALLATEAALAAKFFVAVLSLSQILFFSAVIPLLLEIDIPVKLWEILLLFLLRTIIAIPLIAALMHIFF